MSDLQTLNERRIELEHQIAAKMEIIKPLKQELEAVTTEIYTIKCQQARELSVWKCIVNSAKTIDEAWGSRPTIELCSDVTWQQMLDIATRYFDENGITGWEMTSGGYWESGQFQYKDGYGGGPVLGVFEMSKHIPNIKYAFDYEGY